MTRQLRKRDSNGKLYERPAEIEAAIDIAIQQDLERLKTRGAVSDRQSPEFLPSECLVHLIREAGRERHEERVYGLLHILLGRCAANLKRKIREGALPNAAEVREDILGELGVLFAEDGQADSHDVLDFYECRFDKALSALRIDIFRREQKLARRLEPIEQEVTREDGSENEYAVRDSEEFRTKASQIPRVYLTELLEQLPKNERIAVILCVLMNYKEESDDPLERTAASICKVSGRTIRKRLSRALTKLAELNSKKEGE